MRIPVRRREPELSAERSVISDNDLRNPVTRAAVLSWKVLVVVLLVIGGAGPLIWLVKAATSTTQDILSDPLGWWPGGVHLENLGNAWTKIKIDRYTLNTFIIALGTTFFSLLIATTGAYVLAILKPVYARFLNIMVMATLFIPGIVVLVPLYLTIVRVPIVGISLIDTFWAVWLPGGVSAFNVLVIKQYYAALPVELFDAAKVDGAGPVRTFVSLVLPMSKPILGVIALLAFTFSWKDFLWPLLVLPNPDHRPLSVALAYAERSSEMSLVLAGMLIASVIPIVLFLIFQNQFLRGASAAGAVKG